MSIGVKNFLFALSFIPLLVKIPYIYRAWLDSPLEHGGYLVWILVPISLLLCEISRRNTTSKNPPKPRKSYHLYFGALFILCLVGWGLFNFGGGVVHTFAILFAIAILATSVELRFGWEVFLSQFPSFTYLVLGVPNVMYWMGYYFDMGLGGSNSFLSVKLILGTGLLIFWCLFALLKGRFPHFPSILFCLCVGAILLATQVANNTVPDGDTMRLDMSKLKSGDWIAHEDEVTENDKNFFSGCTYIGRAHYLDQNYEIELLALEVVDITNLHPMPICLKSGGATVLSSEQIYLDVAGKKVQVNELKIRKSGVELFAYSFYANDLTSTGDFAKFRLLRKDKKTWWHYQLITPAQPNDAAVRVRVQSFLNAFAWGQATEAPQTQPEKSSTNHLSTTNLTNPLH